MHQTEKKWTEVFPALALPERLMGMLDEIMVTRITMNDLKSRLRIYITVNTWLKKQYVYELENAVAKEIFKNVTLEVKIIERFRLSSQYTPQHFYRIYRSSMLQELKEVSPLLHQTFLHTDVTFPEERKLMAAIPDSLISRDRRDELMDYINRVFCERAGFHDLSIEGNLVDGVYEDVFFDADQMIDARVTDVMKRNEARRKKAEEGEKTAQKLPNAVQDKKARQSKFAVSRDPDMILGQTILSEPVKMGSLTEDPHEVTVRGEVIATEARETRNGKIIFNVTITDYTDSIRFKLWLMPEDMALYEGVFKKGACFIVRGMMDFDQFDREVMIKSVYAIKKIPPFKEKRMDLSPDKRIELHCHTKMSDMDAVSSATDIIRQAYDWGMSALAITDHGVVQAFPEAYHTYGGKGGIPKDADFKVIYGMEAYIVDDMAKIAFGNTDISTDSPVTVVSVVTTGQSAKSHAIIELAAQRVEKGQLTGSFHTLVNPGYPLPFSIIQVTGINDDMCAGGVTAAEAVARLAEFAQGSPLVFYNAEMEYAFLEKAAGEDVVLPETRVDIVSVVRYLMPQIARTRFDRLMKSLKIPCEADQRAIPRAHALSLLYRMLLDEYKNNNIETFTDLNVRGAVSEDRIRNLPTYHAIILAQNEAGRRNLYTLVSVSHLTYFKKRPRIPKSLIMEKHEGLILGSACSAGELYIALLQGKSDEEIARIVNFYDYLEIQPVGNNDFLVREQQYGITSYDDLREINKKIVKLGEQFRKPVVATCDVHFLNPEDEIFRRIIQAGHGYDDVTQPPLFLHTTEEMLEEFSYLGEEKCREVVITNTHVVADWIEKISPIHPDKCPPVIEHSEEDLQKMCYDRAAFIYGEPIPEMVKARLDKELGSIIKNGYAVMYIIAQRLVQKSREDGYLVGSRGSVGSSLVATMAQITEVNPLPPHYYCPECHYNDFDSEEVRAYGGRAGCDMPDKLCPVCGHPLKKDGFDIPFETFLGFKGDKEPDIDLNFSGDEQGVAQAYTEVIFGKGQTFKAGTIGTVADKTAYGYAMHYFEDRGEPKRRCELERLAAGCVGVRRTTGQHPGGVIVLPKGMDINWFTPVQHPANDMTSPIITTHFDYHSIDKNLLKLDILGHDDPTIIRMLEDLTGTDPLSVPLDDKGVLSLFAGTEALGVKPEDMDGVDLGVLGVPEFGTDFVMGMLRDTKPSSMSELIRISGLSHGTNVWLDNAQYFIKNGDCTLGTAICTRDDIMLNLIAWGVEPEHSFKIMESVRKGKGLSPEQEGEMREHGVPEWYIESCKRIKYMFPKAHAAAYVMNAFRIAYYKINYPLAYYAAMFSIRVTTFDYAIMAQGREHMEEEARRIAAKSELSPKEEEMLKDMKIVREMYARGFSFHRLDLYKAQATRFSILDGKLMPSITSISGLGESVAISIEEAAKKGPFLSRDDLRARTRLSSTLIDLMDSMGILGSLPESNQISLFDMM